MYDLLELQLRDDEDAEDEEEDADDDDASFFMDDFDFIFGPEGTGALSDLFVVSFCFDDVFFLGKQENNPHLRSTFPTTSVLDLMDSDDRGFELFAVDDFDGASTACSSSCLSSAGSSAGLLTVLGDMIFFSCHSFSSSRWLSCVHFFAVFCSLCFLCHS